MKEFGERQALSSQDGVLRAFFLDFHCVSCRRTAIITARARIPGANKQWQKRCPTI
jgi:hypothetical protein